MARVLVTGASGFIGYAVTEALLARGDDVLATDVAINPRLQKLTEQNPGLKFTPGEITEWPLLARLLKDGKPDRIVHCAALVGVPASVGSPIGCFRVNIEGTINLLEAMRFFGGCRSLVFSRRIQNLDATSPASCSRAISWPGRARTPASTSSVCWPSRGAGCAGRLSAHVRPAAAPGVG